MSLAALSRAGFLTLLFPLIIKRGRKWYSRPSARSSSDITETTSPRGPDHLPDTFAEIEPTQPLLGPDSSEEPAQPPPPTDREHGSAFDLAFLRGSILVDAVLTGCIGFTQTGWNLYLGRNLSVFADYGVY